jgi:hypothetical protein
MRALEWAAQKASRRKRPNFAPAVLGAVVDLANCLNLVETEAYALVAEAFEALKAHCEAIGQPLPTNGGFLEGARYLDCSVFEMVHDLRHRKGLPAYCSVRAFFPEGEAVFPGAGIRQRDHIQICVRDPARIIGHFLAD